MDDFQRQITERVLPHYLAGVVDDQVIDCYCFRHVETNDLDTGFTRGLEQGQGLAKLLGRDSDQLSLAIKGARNYTNPSAGCGRSFGIELDFTKHTFLYGLLHGLEISTNMIANRDTLGDVCRAFIAVINSRKEFIKPSS